MSDSRLRAILDAGPMEETLDAAKRVVEELIEWRSGCEAAYGVMTATPRKTLLDVAAYAERHHEHHHKSEKVAWDMVEEMCKIIELLTDSPSALEAVAIARKTKQKELESMEEHAHLPRGSHGQEPSEPVSDA